MKIIFINIYSMIFIMYALIFIVHIPWFLWALSILYKNIWLTNSWFLKMQTGDWEVCGRPRWQNANASWRRYSCHKVLGTDTICTRLRRFDCCNNVFAVCLTPGFVPLVVPKRGMKIYEEPFDAFCIACFFKIPNLPGRLHVPRRRTSAFTGNGGEVHQIATVFLEPQRGILHGQN